MYAENLTKIPAVFSKREYNKAFSLIHDHPFQFGNAKIEQLKPGQTPNIHDYPPWFGNENDQAIMNKDTVLLRKESQDYYIKAVSAENDTLHQKFCRMVTIGNDIICKIQTLGRCLHICWVYYNQPNFENPGVRPSELFTQTALPDLSYVFKLFYKDVLLLEPCNLRVEGILYETKQSILDDTNTTMRCVLTFLASWISGAEVDNLRNAYNDLVTIHNDSALQNLLRCLDAVGTRFAREEPKWELERNKPTKKQKTQRRGRKGSGNKGPRTEKMAEQFSNLCHYMDNLGKNDRRSPRAKVFSFWQKNKERFERDADAQGESRGYPSAQHLYTAYQSKMSRRN